MASHRSTLQVFGIYVFMVVVFGMSSVFAQENTVHIYGSDQGAPSQKESVGSSTEPALAPTVVLPLNEDEKPPQRRSYQVQRGDTLWRISKNTGVSLDRIKGLNHLKNDIIRVGDVLILEDDPLEIRRTIPLVEKPLAPPVIVEEVTPPSSPPSSSNIQKPSSSVSPEALKNSSPADPAQEVAPATPSSPITPPAIEKAKPLKPTVSLKDRFVTEIRKMIAARVHYNGSWRPEGSDRNWAMDCSNTTRFLFYKLFRIDIGRTASEQYYRLKIKGRAWDVPQDSAGRPDMEYLHAQLKVGDLLFWENTYEPERDPPITHVTVYMGLDDRGRFLMVGSEQGKGLIDQGFNGPDLYYFNPLAEKGGYHAFLFMGWRPGHFVAHGRPLPESIVQVAGR